MRKMASNLIQCRSGSKAYGSKVLFDQATVSINEREHVGLIGVNGTGKTTLMRILAEEDQLDSGEIIFSRKLKIGYLPQESHWSSQETLSSFLKSCIKPIWELKTLGHGLGLKEAFFDRPIQSLSGGFRMRCKLLYLIGCEPNLLLLDEPTNYLDLETLLVLEQFLIQYRGAFLVISHDREFLRHITDHVIEIENGKITKFPGNIDHFFEQKALIEEQLQKQACSLEEKRKKILAFASRFGAKASKARQVKSRLKSLEKMEKIEIKPIAGAARFCIPEPMRVGRRVLRVHDLSLGYGQKVVLKKVHFELERGDHVAVVGINGAGKSTLLKGLAGMLSPMRGEITYGYQVAWGYYGQHISERLDPNKTVLEELQHDVHPDVSAQEILNLAGSLLFSGGDRDKKIKILSGGEKARVGLGKILLKKAPLLLLDEVTNHLDFETVEALTEALHRYPGTIVFVSHDRGFVQRVSTKILEVFQGKAFFYLGNYEAYVWSLEKRNQKYLIASDPSTKQNKKISSSKKTVSQKKQNQALKKTLQQKIRVFEKKSHTFEKQIQSLQKRMLQINNLLKEPPSDLAQRKKHTEELGSLQFRLHDLEQEWMQLLEEIEKTKKQLKKALEVLKTS